MEIRFEFSTVKILMNIYKTERNRLLVNRQMAKTVYEAMG